MSEQKTNEQQRLDYMKTSPRAVRGLQMLEHYLNAESGLGMVLLEMVRLRASQMNGCLFCLGMHRHELRKQGEPESRIDAVEGWRESDAFSERERAALRWAEVVTDIQDGHAADEEYAAMREFFDEKEMVDLTAAVAGINAWNRIAITFRPQWDQARAERRDLPEAKSGTGESGTGEVAAR